jgi:tRNA 2-thiouridine synthesizing protein A
MKLQSFMSACPMTNIDHHIDITTETCPMTFVRVKLKLEKIPSGTVLSVVLKGEEPLRNVPRSAQAEGHQILASEAIDLANNLHRILIRRA